MTKPVQSDASIRRRKKLQGNISIAGGTLGLTALAAKGGSVATAGGRAGRLLKIKHRPETSQKLKDASTGLTTLGAGIGGMGAYNFASYTKAEARKRPATVRKSAGGTMDFGLDGVRQGISKRYDESVEKAYDPEKKRQRRLDHTSTALAVGSGAAAAGAGKFASQAWGKKSGTGHTGIRAKSLPAYQKGLKSAGKAGALGVTAMGLAVGSDRVRSYKKGRGGRYRPLAQGWD